MTLAVEKLAEQDGIMLSAETLRRWLRAEGTLCRHVHDVSVTGGADRGGQLAGTVEAGGLDSICLNNLSVPSHLYTLYTIQG